MGAVDSYLRVLHPLPGAGLHFGIDGVKFGCLPHAAHFRPPQPGG